MSSGPRSDVDASPHASDVSMPVSASQTTTPSFNSQNIDMTSIFRTCALLHQSGTCSVKSRAIVSWTIPLSKHACYFTHHSQGTLTLRHQKEPGTATSKIALKSYSTMPATSTPSIPGPPSDLATLFTTLEASLANTNLGPNRWYLIVLAALVGGTEPEFSDKLYLHLTSQPSYQSSASRQALVQRLREALVKLVSIVGVCKPLEAILAISKVERPEDRDYTFTRQDWSADAANHERGATWLKKIYAGNTEDTLALFDAHRDFRWISEEITYGLYLSDRRVLDDWDTEVVVLAGIMIQNLKLETKWHIRGALRVGMSKEDVGAIMECVRKVAEVTDVKLHRIPAVEDVEHEV